VTRARRLRIVVAAASCLWLLSAGALSDPAAAGDGGEQSCPCDPFDEPERVVRSGYIDIQEDRLAMGSEIYLANRTLRIGGGETRFVVAGRDDERAGALRLQARERIVLGPGFHARPGSRVQASIIPLRRAGQSHRASDFARRR
jgi:hypothetical protein